MTFSSTTFSLADFTLELPANVTGTLAFNANDTALIVQGLKDPPPMHSELLPAQFSAASLSLGGDDSSSSSSDVAAANSASVSDSGLDPATTTSDLVGGNDTRFDATPTPEPGSALLLTLGAGTLLGWRRRRR